MLTLIQGPAGGGKSAVAAAMLASGEADILADITALWVALSGVQRGPDGRYPVRSEDDPALRLALYLQRAAVRQGLATTVPAGFIRLQASVTVTGGYVRPLETIARPLTGIGSRPANVIVTTSRRGQVARWQAISDEAGTTFDVRTVDPGEDTVRNRLAEPQGGLTEECEEAIQRWYGTVETWR